MELKIENWIEGVRQKPEHIRERYVLVCVAIVMTLIFGVWLLTVQESFQSISTETSEATGNAGELLSKPADFSLDALLKNKETLGTEKETVSGQEFFQGEYQNKNEPRFEEEGVAPVQEEAR